MINGIKTLLDRYSLTIILVSLFFLIPVRLLVVAAYAYYPNTEITQLYNVFNNDLFIFVVSVFNASFVAVTIYEMEHAKKLQFNPKLTVKLEPLGTNWTMLKVKNVGGGYAQNIKLGYTIGTLSQTVSKIWKTPIIWAGDEEKILIEEINFKQFLEKYDSVSFTIVYSNSFKEFLEDRIVLNLKETLVSISENFQLWEPEKIEDFIKNISKNTDDLKSSFENISKNIEYIAARERERIEKEKLEKMRELLDKRPLQEKSDKQ